MKLMKLVICYILLFSWIGVASAVETPIFHRMVFVNEWGGALDTEEKVKSIIDDAAYMNCDAVMLYVGSEYFEAAKNPAHSSWDSRVSWNMLETAIEYAHNNNNIELHVWYHINYASSNLRAERRLWGTEYNFVYRDGTIHPYRTDLAFSELFNYEIENIKFIAEHYPELDGIHLEEPYYPYSQSYSTAMRDRIKSKYGYDPLYKPEADMIPIINEEMAQVINEFFTEARATTTNANPNLQFSANGLHRYSLHTGFDPSYMSSNGLLDWYAAQIYRTYTYGSNGFEDCVIKLNEFVTEIPIVAISGITYATIYPSTNPEFFEQVEKACDFGSDAVGIFAWYHRNALINETTAMEGLHNIVPPSTLNQTTQTMNISYTSTPVIDGLKDDWAGMIGVSFNDDSGRGSADNTANVKAAWDDSYLYFAFEVADTNLQAVETVRDGALSHDDVVEIYIDTLNNDGSLMQTDDYHFLVSLNNAVADQKGTGSGKDASWDCGIVSVVTIDGTLWDASDIDTGYFVELAIPWSDIGGTPLEGSVIGLDLAIGDRDSIADGYQYFDWSNLTSFAYPDGWGDAFLIDNTAPILDPIGDKSVDIGSPLQFTISASDFDNDPLTYSTGILPGGASFNPTTRTFSWTPVEGQAGTYTVHFEVTDSCLNDSENIMIAVNESIISPTPSVKPTMNVSHTSTPVIDGLKDDWAGMSGVLFEDDSGRGSADNTASVKALWNDDYLYVAFEVADTNLQAVEVVRDGALSLDDVVEVYIDTLNNDGSLMQTDDYHFLVNLNNAVGDKKGTGSGKDASWDCGIVSAVTIDGTVGDDSDTDTGYFVELAIPWSDIGGTPLEGSVIGLDLAIGDRDSIADGYQYFDWSNLTSFAYPDGWGDAFLIDNTAPILDPIGDKSVDIGSPLQFTISATDPDSDLLTYSATDLPTGASLDATTGAFTWTPSDGQAGTHVVTFVVSDGSLADSEAVTITVNEINHAPVLASIGARSVDEESTLIFTLSASDVDGNSMTYSATNLPDGASFNTASGAFSWTPADGQAGNYVVTFEVTDGYLSDSEAVTIIVNDVNHAPVITVFEPADGSVFNEKDSIIIGVIATDADGQALTYSIKIDGDTKSTTSSYIWKTKYTSAGTHTIDVTVSDGTDQVTAQHTITINDVHPRWDVNEDSSVNILDITIIGQKVGTTVEEPLPRWDVNQDGVVNIQDMLLAGYYFGETVV